MGNGSNTSEDVNTLAKWAMEKDNNLATIKKIKQAQGMDNERKVIPQKQNGTYRPVLTAQPGGDAMELVATKREPNRNLSVQEFRERRNTKRYLKCARRGHMMRE